MSGNRHTERRDTDRRLTDERRRADEKLEERQRVAADHSDKLLAATRQQSDVALADMRAEEDRHRAEATAAATVARTEAIRREQDSDLARQRASEDRHLEGDRAERRALFAALLAEHRARTDAALRLERDRSDATIASHDNFLAVASHDVRGLASAIKLSSEAILKAMGDVPEDDAVKSGVERIRLAASHIDALVADLLDVAAIAARSLVIHPAVRDAAAVVQDAVAIIEPVAAEKSIAVHTRGLDEPMLARIDERRVLQVLANVLGNAVKFSHRGTTIDVGLTRVEGGVRCSVTDVGIGIDPASLETIFDRFHRGTRSDVEGAGLGLYIAKGIVEAHGGRIWVESRPDVGSSFHFTLPGDAPDR